MFIVAFGEKCFPFIAYVCILFHAFSLPSCYIGTGTLLIDKPSCNLGVNLEFSVYSGWLWVITVVVFI